MLIPSASERHSVNLDFVRALAVLMVVFSHLGWFLGDVRFSFLIPSFCGKLGVVIFFVHSAIVNMMSLERHVDRYGGKRLFLAFMTRRSLRIFPLSVFVVLSIFLLRLPVSNIKQWGSAGLAQWSFWHLLPSLLLVQNFFRFPQVLEPLWSLPYEVQIYCLFPLLFLAISRLRTSKALLIAWVALAFVDFSLGPHFLKHNVFHSFIVPDMLCYLLLFAAGLYAYKEMQTAEAHLPFWTLPALLGAIVLCWLLTMDPFKFQLASLCLGVTLPYMKASPFGQLNRICAWVAKYSYGIYLLHDPAIWFGFVRCAALPMLLRVIIFVAATFGGSYVLYHLVEHPMIVVGNRLSAKVVVKAKKENSLAASA